MQVRGPAFLQFREKEEVAALYETALASGSRGIREPNGTLRGGHIAYGVDPDGHIREFAWDPFLLLGSAGGILVEWIRGW